MNNNLWTELFCIEQLIELRANIQNSLLSESIGSLNCERDEQYIQKVEIMVRRIDIGGTYCDNKLNKELLAKWGNNIV